MQDEYGILPRMRQLAQSRLFSATLFVFALVSAAQISYAVFARGPLYALTGLPQVLEVIGLLMLRNALAAEDGKASKTAGLTMVFWVEIVTGVLMIIAFITAGIILLNIPEEDFEYIVNQLQLSYSFDLNELGLGSGEVDMQLIRTAAFRILLVFAAVSGLYYTMTAISVHRVRAAVKYNAFIKKIPPVLIGFLAVAAVLSGLTLYQYVDITSVFIRLAEVAKVALFAYCAMVFNKQFQSVPL